MKKILILGFMVVIFCILTITPIKADFDFTYQCKVDPENEEACYIVAFYGDCIAEPDIETGLCVDTTIEPDSD